MQFLFNFFLVLPLSQEKECYIFGVTTIFFWVKVFHVGRTTMKFQFKAELCLNAIFSFFSQSTIIFFLWWDIVFARACIFFCPYLNNPEFFNNWLGRSGVTSMIWFFHTCRYEENEMNQKVASIFLIKKLIHWFLILVSFSWIR